MGGVDFQKTECAALCCEEAIGRRKSTQAATSAADAQERHPSTASATDSQQQGRATGSTTGSDAAAGATAPPETSMRRIVERRHRTPLAPATATKGQKLTLGCNPGQRAREI